MFASTSFKATPVSFTSFMDHICCKIYQDLHAWYHLAGKSPLRRPQYDLQVLWITSVLRFTRISMDSTLGPVRVSIMSTSTPFTAVPVYFTSLIDHICVKIYSDFHKAYCQHCNCFRYACRVSFKTMTVYFTIFISHTCVTIYFHLHE